MKYLVEFPMESGGTIFVEVEGEEPEGMVEAAAPGEVMTKAQQTFEDALGKIRPVAQAVINKIKNLSEPPDEVGVEFGLKVDAEVGAFLAAAKTEAGITVSMTWRKPAPEQSGS